MTAGSRATGKSAAAIPPTPAERLAFLVNLERLLSEGSFVATYKYALLIALAELAVERADDSGAEFEIELRDVAAKFIELYWRQALPYGDRIADAAAGVLIQNTGDQAVMINVVAELRARHGTLGAAQKSAQWKTAVSRVPAELLVSMPLWRLQKLRHGTLEFLYRKGTRPDGFCCCAESPRTCGISMHSSYARSRVSGCDLSKVACQPAHCSARRRICPTSCSAPTAAPSAAPAKGSARCSRGNASIANRGCRKRPTLDHFIPWSRYPRDLVHNLVAAHRTCNANKSDLLAAEPHRRRWAEWVDRRDADLEEIGRAAGLIVDRPTALSVAHWSYAHARQIGAEVWLGGSVYAPIEPGG